MLLTFIKSDHFLALRIVSKAKFGNELRIWRISGYKSWEKNIEKNTAYDPNFGTILTY